MDTMKIEYDVQRDRLNLEFLPNVPIYNSREMHGVVINYTRDQRIVGMELLDTGKTTSRQPLDLIDLAVIRSRSHAVDSVRKNAQPSVSCALGERVGR